MTDSQLKEHCCFVGGLIPKLSKIYDGLEELECVEEVREISANYNDVTKNGVSKHYIEVTFNVVPFHEQIEMFTKKLNDLVVSQDAEVVHLFVQNLALDDTKNPSINNFEIDIKWEV